MESKQTVGKKRGFTLAEALVLLLITALIIVATMPVITRKKRHRQDYKFGPPGGWVCKKEDMPCPTFNPPAKAKNFVFYFDDSLIPSFSTREMGAITIQAPAPRKTHQEPSGPAYYVPPTESKTEGYGKHDNSWDEYKKKGHTIQEEDKTSTSGGYWNTPTHTVVDDEGGCKGKPDLYRTLEEYTKGKVKISGDYCTEASMVRIVY